MGLLLDVVRTCKTSTGEILLPRYDKSLHDGRGDRAPQSEWAKKHGASPCIESRVCDLPC